MAPKSSETLSTVPRKTASLSLLFRTTKTRYPTSLSVMRTAVAFTLALALFSIITVCPLIACPLVDQSGKGCCHKQQPAPRPCVLEVCPYAILEGGKTVPTIAQIPSVGL